jgi:N-acetylglutamate synthase-like GNAT family acetyltransferase
LMVREASREDLEVLARLMTELGYPSSTEDMSQRFEEISTDPSHRVLVAEQGGLVLGTVRLHEAPVYHTQTPLPSRLLP